MKKFLLLILLAIVLTVSSYASGSDESGSQALGALIRNTDEQFVKDYAETIKRLGKEKGIEVKLLDSRGDMATQIDQLNTLLSQGVKYFIIVSNTSEATEDMAKSILARGGGAAFSNIQPTLGALQVAPSFYFASSPEFDAGRIQASILDDYFKKHPEKMKNGDPNALDALLILGQLGHPAQKNRTTAVLEGLKTAGYKVNVLAQDTANWKPSEAQELMDVWANSFDGKFDVVIANNDGMALGAVESLLTHSYVDDPNDKTADTDGDGTVLKVPVIGVDATQVALQSMSNNQLYATVLQDATGQATTAFELVYAMATGEEMNGIVVNGNVRSLEAPIPEEPCNDASVIDQCYLVPFKSVTKDNYKDFVMVQ